MSEIVPAEKWNLSEVESDTLGIDVERAWAAGFFDGEGHSGMVRSPNRYPTFRVAVSQATDYVSLHRFAGIMGVGKIYGPYPKGEKWGPLSQFYAHNDEAMHVIAVMLPYLGKVKLTQALRASTAWRTIRREEMQRAQARRDERKRALRERTHCKHGHELTPETTYPASDDPTRLDCLICRRESALRSYYRNR